MKKAIIYITCIGLGLGIVWTIKKAMVENRVSEGLDPGYSISRQVQYGRERGRVFILDRLS